MWVNSQCSFSVCELRCSFSVCELHCSFSICEFQCSFSVCELQCSFSICELQCLFSICELQCSCSVCELRCSFSVCELICSVHARYVSCSIHFRMWVNSQCSCVVGTWVAAFILAVSWGWVQWHAAFVVSSSWTKTGTCTVSCRQDGKQDLLCKADVSLDRELQEGGTALLHLCPSWISEDNPGRLGKKQCSFSGWGRNNLSMTVWCKHVDSLMHADGSFRLFFIQAPELVWPPFWS